jgi:hypothetical protein
MEIRDEITSETPAARISRQRLMTWDSFVCPVSPRKNSAPEGEMPLGVQPPTGEQRLRLIRGEHPSS